MILVKGNLQSCTHFGRCLLLAMRSRFTINEFFWIWTDVITGLMKSFLKISNSLQTCPASFPRSTECLSSGLHSKFLSEGIDVSSCSSTWCIPCRGSCQVLVCRRHFLLSLLPFSLAAPSLPSFLLHVFIDCLYHVRQSLLLWIFQVTVED